MTPRGRLAAVVAAVLAAAPHAAHAQPADVQPADAAAQALLTAGDTLAAYRTVRAALDAPGTPSGETGLERLRLVIERTGAGLRRLPMPLRRRRTVDTARRLLALDPASPLALETLADDVVATALFFRDRGPRVRTGGAVTPAEASVRLRGSRFDIGQRAAVRPLLDRAAPGRAASAEAGGLLDALLATEPATAAPFLTALAVAERRWGRLDTLAAALSDPPGEPAGHARTGPDPAAAALAAGLAAWRSGRTEAAEQAFETALAGLAPAERARLTDLAPLLTPDSLAAYRADPDGFARRFWARTDPRRITPAHERRLEHVARVLEADALFGRPLADLFTRRPRRGAETDRGRVWVRYGRPDRETGFTQDDGLPTYSRDAVAAYVVWEYDALDGGTRVVFDDPGRDGRYRTYSPPASAFAETNGAAAADDYVAQDRLLQAEQPDGFADTLAAPLPLVAARFRGADGGTEAVVAFPAAPRAALFLGDDPVPGDASAGVAVVRLGAPGRLRAETLDASGTWFAVAEADLVPLAASGFAISDLLVVGGAGAGVVRGEAVLVPLVADTLARGAVAVYAEAYGLSLSDGRTEAEAEVRLVPADGRSGVRRVADRLFGRRRRAGVAAAADVSGTTATESLSLSLDGTGLSPGAYRLVLRVTDRRAGVSAEASRAVVLR